MNLFAAIAGVAVVSAGVALAAVELAGRHDNGSSAPRPAAAAKLPYYGPGGLPSPVQPLVPVQRGSGSATLPPFMPNEPYYVQFSCSGGGTFRFVSLGGPVSESVPRCNGAITTVQEPATTAPLVALPAIIAPTTLRLTAAASTTWEIFVAQKGSNALPPLGGAGLPSPAHVLIPMTVESGSVTLPAFTPTRPYYIEDACVGSFGPFDIVTTDATVHWLVRFCGSVVSSTIMDPPSTEVLGKPVTLHVVAPDEHWEILVVESTAP